MIITIGSEGKCGLGGGSRDGKGSWKDEGNGSKVYLHFSASPRPSRTLFAIPFRLSVLLMILSCGDLIIIHINPLYAFNRPKDNHPSPAADPDFGPADLPAAIVRCPGGWLR